MEGRQGGDEPEVEHSFGFRARVAGCVDGTGPKAGSFKGSFVSSPLEIVRWFNCKASS